MRTRPPAPFKGAHRAPRALIHQHGGGGVCGGDGMAVWGAGRGAASSWAQAGIVTVLQVPGSEE